MTSLVKPTPFAVEHADVDQMRAGRDAVLVERGRTRADRAGNDAGDVRAVAKRVSGARFAGREIHRGRGPSRQRRVVRDARIDDRHADALAVHRRRPQQKAKQSAAARPRKVRAHGAIGHGHRRTNDVVERDGGDAGDVLQRVEQSRSGLDDDEAVEHSQHLDAVACGGSLNRRDVAAHDRADRTIVAIDDELQQVGRQQVADQRQEQFVDQRSDNRQVAEQRAEQAGLGANRRRRSSRPTMTNFASGGQIVSRRYSWPLHRKPCATSDLHANRFGEF